MGQAEGQAKPLTRGIVDEGDEVTASLNVATVGLQVGAHVEIVDPVLLKESSEGRSEVYVMETWSTSTQTCRYDRSVLRPSDLLLVDVAEGVPVLGDLETTHLGVLPPRRAGRRAKRWWAWFAKDYFFDNTWVPLN